MPKRYSKSKRSLKLKRKSLKSRRRNSKLKRSLKRKKGGSKESQPKIPNLSELKNLISTSEFYQYMKNNYYDPNIFDIVIKVLIKIVEDLIVLQKENQFYPGYYLEDITITGSSESPTITFNYEGKTKPVVGQYPVDNIILSLGILILTIYNISNEINENYSNSAREGAPLKRPKFPISVGSVHLYDDDGSIKIDYLNSITYNEFFTIPRFNTLLGNRKKRIGTLDINAELDDKTKEKHKKLFNLAKDCVNLETPDNKPKSLEAVVFKLKEIISNESSPESTEV